MLSPIGSPLDSVRRFSGAGRNSVYCLIVITDSLGPHRRRSEVPTYQDQLSSIQPVLADDNNQNPAPQDSKPT